MHGTQGTISLLASQRLQPHLKDELAPSLRGDLCSAQLIWGHYTSVVHEEDRMGYGSDSKAQTQRVLFDYIGVCCRGPSSY